MRTEGVRPFGLMALFFAAMAFLESAVVVYLRALYYPTGFQFPLVPMDPILVTTEVFREVATMVMLLVPGALLTRSALERFAWFCFGFGVWDLFYYIWLKVLLDWPSSLASRDLLFLIPVPWEGPVWAPCLIAVGLVVLALLILRGRARGAVRVVDGWSWTSLIAGAVLMIVSFTLDPILRSYGVETLMDPGTLSEARTAALQEGRSHVPEYFPWPWYLAGCLVAMVGLARVHRSGKPLA